MPTAVFGLLALIISVAAPGESAIAADSGSLREAAVSALGGREGTVLVVDPRTGRLLVAINPRLAFEQAYPPGSAIKPFALLSVLASGRLAVSSAHHCRGGPGIDGRNLLCVHPRLDRPLSLAEGLAYSCNDLFLTIGERLTSSAFGATLRGFGFGSRTGLGRAESAGRLPEGDWQAETALGEGGDLLVTPIQLLRAYLGLVSGGRLCRPMTSDERCTSPPRIGVNDAHRRLLIEGMRGAVSYGTAARAGLAVSDGQIFGKTGTSAASNGFRRQGWFVGFRARRAAGIPGPEELDLAVLVMLRRGSGAEAATVAAPVLAQRLPSVVPAAWRPDSAGAQTGGMAETTVRVRSIGEGRTRRLPLNEYLRGVLRAELGGVGGSEALRAQAVVSRTFAMANLGRHADEGYDFCSTTHCQRFEAGDSGPAVRSRRPSDQAVEATAGEVLRDATGAVAEVYYHASCGGATANIATLWGVTPPPAHLRGVRDPGCQLAAARRWEDHIRREDLEAALRADPRTDVGGRLSELTVERVDPTGRAEWVRLRGSREKRIRGWEFRMIVDRRLGWHLLKSSRLTIEREADGWRFRGNGFGHGLGLCQDGARTLARQGHSYRRILAHYFPGTRIAVTSGERMLGQTPPEPTGGDLSVTLVADQPRRLTELFRWEVAPGVSSRHVAEAREILETAARDLSRRLAAASIPWPGNQPVEVHVHASTAEFIRATGLSGWASGATRGDRVDLQPLDLLIRRRLLTSTLRHELVHAILARAGDPSSPRWLHEGLAIHFAGEGAAWSRQAPIPGMTTDRLESQLANPPGRAAAGRLYAAAWREVVKLISTKGEAAVWSLALRRNGLPA